MNKIGLTALALLLVAGMLAACGSAATDGTGGAGGAQPEPAGETVELQIEATNFAFDQKEYRVKAGDTVNIAFKSAQGMHGMQIKGMNINLKDGQTASFTAKAGKYEIICSIMCGSGHGGMMSKLIVE